MDKLTKKQFVKRKTLIIAYDIYRSLVPEEDALTLTMKQVHQNFPKASFFKDVDSGMIKTGFSLKGIRKLVKAHPEITVEQVKQYFNMDTQGTPEHA
jgi:hypothetical protein